MSDEPLDPNEGPTLWVSSEEVATAEERIITLKTGTDPKNPMDTIRMNEHEYRRLRRLLE